MSSNSGKPPRNERIEQFLKQPYRAVWTLAVPIMMGMAVQTIYSVADMIFVGRISASAIAALAFNMPLLWFSYGIIFGLGSGVTAVIARFIGAQQKDQAENTALHGLFLGLGLGSAFTIAAFLLGERILSFLGVPPDILPAAVSYFYILAGGFLFTMFGIFLRSIFNGEGDTKTPMKIQVFSTLLNIALDPLFIFGFSMGVAGAALATVISQILTASVLTYFLLIKKRTYVQLRLRNFKYDHELLRAILRIGLPASMAMIIMSSGSAAFNRILVHYSAAVVAGYQISGRLDQIFFLPIMALGNSLVTLVGMYYGARRLDLVKKVIRYTLARGVLIGVVSGVVFFISAPYVFRIFTPDPEVQAVAVSVIRTLSFVYWVITIGILSGRSMQGLGTGIPSLVITTVRVLGVSVPLAIFFVFVLHKPYYWVWWAMVASSCTAATISLFWLRHRYRLAKMELMQPEPYPTQPETFTTGSEY